MRVLVADDDLVQRRLLENTLRQWGHEVALAGDGQRAFDALADPAGPSLALIDWMMPGMDGDEVCRRLREDGPNRPLYLILLTARKGKEDLVRGLRAGADDYIIKPFDREELFARLQVGLRVVGLQHRLAEQVRAANEALSRVRQLQGLLPICCYCHNVRTDENYWQKVERYFADHTDVQFTHSICPGCYAGVVEPQLREAGILHQT